jgi:signal peptidase I
MQKLPWGIAATVLAAVLAVAGCEPATTTSAAASVSQLPSHSSGCTLPLLRLDGESMVGTIQNGDLLCTVQVDPTALHRGDIIAFHPPNDVSRTFVKRVLALPGDVLEIDGARTPTALLIEPSGQGAFEVASEPYLPEPWTTETFCCRVDGRASGGASPVTVPQNAYFVMGDNRNRSSDSRMFGFVPAPYILALVTSDTNRNTIPGAMPSLMPS